MESAISLAIYVHNQTSELFALMERLDKSSFAGEFIVVVIGGEDPFENAVLELENKSYVVRAIYMETWPSQKAIEKARRLAKVTSQYQSLRFLSF